MARTKQVRWECPNGLHPGKLGSSRPRANATVRYCLPCSDEAGVLVERVSPAMERKRNAKSAAAAARAQAKREREREEKANRYKVAVIDAAGEEHVLDAMELLKAAWRSETLCDERSATWASPRRVPVPELVIRRGKGRSGRAGRQDDDVPEGCLPIRARDTMSGHAAYDGSRIVLTCGPRLGEEWLRAIVVHEAAHGSCPWRTHHGGRWRRAYVKAVRELYPGLPLAPMSELDALANWQLDEHVALAIYNAGER